MRYEVRFSEEARAHLRELSARERRAVFDRVRTVLGDQPTRETRNLKVLRPNPVAKFELRIGALRVFFEINGGGREVLVLAIGRKEGNRLLIGAKEVTL
jgi:mRNA-degrading endonuclease RelE of RelBE toxin-antitoxin system